MLYSWHGILSFAWARKEVTNSHKLCCCNEQRTWIVVHHNKKRIETFLKNSFLSQYIHVLFRLSLKIHTFLSQWKRGLFKQWKLRLTRGKKHYSSGFRHEVDLLHPFKNKATIQFKTHWYGWLSNDFFIPNDPFDW